MWDTLTITAIPVWLDNKKPPDNVTYKFYFYADPVVHENRSGESDKQAFYCDFDALPRVYIEVIYNNITKTSPDLVWK
jgi:hypothetical protein